MSEWANKRLLIWGKTYPEFSKNYYETVCTGAVDLATGDLVRIYPITLRYLKEHVSLYDIIEADVLRNTSDPRPASFKINQDSIRKVGHLEAGPKGWPEREKAVLRPQNIHASVEALQVAQVKSKTSLGMVKPAEVTKVYKRYKADEERKHWEAQREVAIKQKELFVDADSGVRDLAFCPVQYRIKFRCDDVACNTEHDFGLMNWDLYQLDYKIYAERGGKAAEDATSRKVLELMDPAKHDSYFFLGNTKPYPQNFMVVGLFHPPKVLQTAMFTPV